MKRFKMATNCEGYPSEASLQELISSFPHEWQGLFAALNVKECLAVQSGTSWLRDGSYSLQKNFISPHWPDLVRSLCLAFPVLSEKEVIFQPKLACFTLKLQRNMLCFVNYHCESIPVDDIKALISMLVKLPQMKLSWFASLIATIQTRINCLEAKHAADMEECRGGDLKTDKAMKVKIRELHISEQNKTRLDNLCSRIKASSASFALLTSKLELMATQSKVQVNNLEDKMINLHENLLNPVTDMDVENFIQAEVIEISDDSPTSSQCGNMEVPKPPEFSTLHETNVNVTVHPPRLTDLPNPPDSSTLHKTQDRTISPVTTLPIAPFSEVPHSPGLEICDDVTEIINMELDPSQEDTFLQKYSHLKDHLRSSEDLDVEKVQEFLCCFSEDTPKNLVKICNFLEMATIPESSTVMLIRQFLSLANESSYQATVVFTEQCIGTWMCTMQQPGSRNLVAGVAAFAQKHPKAFVDGIMVKQFDPTCLQWPQCDLILKVVKKFEKDTLQYFVERLFQSREDFQEWNEQMVLLLSEVLGRRLDLNASIFANFVDCLQFQSLPLASSLKFAKFLLTVISKYGPLVKPSLASFRQILEENNTFLKKSGLTALKKLED